MSNPKVSIITLTYDRRLFIERAVQSVLDQTFTDWELIIVDDGTGNEAENSVRNLFKNDSRLKYFHRAQKTRIAGASNFGLAKARGEYIAILDDDDYWAMSAKLEKQVEFLDKNTEYVGCGGGYVLIDEKGNEQGRYLKPESDASIRKSAMAANSMVNSTTLFRRAVTEQIGGYDESLLQFVDWDFWLRMGLQGKLYNFQEHFLFYRVWSGGSSFLRQKENAISAFQILNRHRGEYPGFFEGFVVAVAYLFHACLPVFVKKYSSPFFSRLKKFLFSASR